MTNTPIYMLCMDTCLCVCIYIYTHMQDWKEKSRQGQEGEERQIFVRGLPYSMRPEDLARIFGKAGEVQMIQGMFAERRATGRAWVTYTTGNGAEGALSLHKTEIQGRFIEVYPPWSRPARQALRQVARSQQETSRDEDRGGRYEDRRGRSPAPYREGDMYERRDNNRYERDGNVGARSSSVRTESASSGVRSPSVRSESMSARRQGEETTPTPATVCLFACIVIVCAHQHL